MKQLGVAALAMPALLLVSTSAHAVSSAELYQTSAEFYGRFEARMRFAPGDGVVSSFFLWKSGSDASGAFWNELDFEKLGADCHLQTNAIFGAPNVGHPQINTVAGNLCGEYHTYGFEWAPTYISWQIDGVEVRRDVGATASAFTQNAASGMQIHFNVWPGDASFGGNFSPGILPVYQYISWVQYSSYAAGSFTAKWREDFNAASAPSAWAIGNWASPKGYSTHSAANVNFVNGISILSLTNDSATGFSGTPPSDGATAGAGGASGSATGGTSAGGASGNATGGASVGGSGGAGSSGGPGSNVGGSNTGGQGIAGAGTSGAFGSAGLSGNGGGGLGSTAGAGSGQASGVGNAASGGAASNSGGANGGTTPTASSDGCGCHIAARIRPFSSFSTAFALAAMLVFAGRRRSSRR